MHVKDIVIHDDQDPIQRETLLEMKLLQRRDLGACPTCGDAVANARLFQSGITSDGSDTGTVMRHDWKCVVCGFRHTARVPRKIKNPAPWPDWMPRTSVSGFTIQKPTAP